MRAIYHLEYKTERELDDAIARLGRFAEDHKRSWQGPGYYAGVREELLYDLANRRDDGELRWIDPEYYIDHVLWWFFMKGLEERARKMLAGLD